MEEKVNIQDQADYRIDYTRLEITRCFSIQMFKTGDDNT